MIAFTKSNDDDDDDDNDLKRQNAWSTFAMLRLLTNWPRWRAQGTICRSGRRLAASTAAPGEGGEIFAPREIVNSTLEQEQQ